jgi:DNA-nicking Smr family endonuclease
MKHGHRWGNGMAARRLGDGEQRLWFETMREVRPLRGRAPCTPPDDRPDGVGSAAAAAPPGPLAALALVSRPVPRPAPFRPPIEIGARQRRLDLHGQRAQSAFLLLHAFLIRAQAERLRCVEIITGAGTGPEGGILRRELPLWLSRPDLRPLVLAAVHPHARNVGSVRLLLRRRAG